MAALLLRARLRAFACRTYGVTEAQQHRRLSRPLLVSDHLPSAEVMPTSATAVSVVNPARFAVKGTVNV
jgi:hypothetical protein